MSLALMDHMRYSVISNKIFLELLKSFLHLLLWNPITLFDRRFQLGVLNIFKYYLLANYNGKRFDLCTKLFRRSLSIVSTLLTARCDDRYHYFQSKGATIFYQTPLSV